MLKINKKAQIASILIAMLFSANVHADYYNLTDEAAYVSATTGSISRTGYDPDDIYVGTGTAPGAENINGALFDAFPNSDVLGTGYIDSFLRTQAIGQAGCTDTGTQTGSDGTAAVDGCQQGYNTNNSEAEPWDVQNDPMHNWNHLVNLDDLQALDVDGVDYYEFFLDINEPGGDKEFISLDELQFFVTTLDGNGDAGLSGYNDDTNLFDLMNDTALAWELDLYNDLDINQGAVYDSYIEAGNRGTGSLDAVTAPSNNNSLIIDNNSGSGLRYDLRVLVPVDYFTVASGRIETEGPRYVVLFNRFGDVNEATADQGGFEEWYTRTSVEPTYIPAPPAFALILIGMVALMRKRKFIG